MSLCSEHNDHNPSLSIKKDGDQVILHCFAGCPYEEIVHELESRGIEINNQAGFIRDNRLPSGIPKQFKDKYYIKICTKFSTIFTGSQSQN